MKREKELAKNTIIIGISQISTKFLSFILLPVYTAFLTPTEYGTFDYYVSIQNVLMILVFLQLEQAVFRFLINERDNEVSSKAIISTTIQVAFVCCFVFIILFIPVILFFKNSYANYLLINVLLIGFCNILLWICRGLGDNMSYSIGSFICGSIQIFLNIVFIVFMKIGVTGLFLSALFGNVFTILFIILRKKLWTCIFPLTFNKSICKQIIKYALPFIPNQLSWWLFSGVNTLLITHFIGISQNGTAGVANKIAAIMSVAGSIYQTAWLESVSVHISDHDRDIYINKMLDVAIRLFYSLYVAIMMATSVLFPIVINSDYSQAFYLTPLYLLASLLGVIQTLFGVFYSALMIPKGLAKSTVIAGIINVLIHLILIKYCGIYASGISLIVAYATISLYRIVDVRNHIAIKLNFRIYITMFAFVVLLYSAYVSNTVCIRIVSFLTIFIYIVLLNKDFVRKIYDSVLLGRKRP